MRILLIFISFMFLTRVQAQPLELQGLDYDQIASYYIQYLKKGTLLVRLQTKNRKIAILKRSGNISAAKKVKEDQLKVNKSILAAFRSSFNFCPVLFFYSDDSKYIVKNQLDSVAFLNDSLQKIENIIIKPEQFLVAHFGVIKEDTSQNFAGYRNDGSYTYQKDSADQLYRNKYYRGGTNMSFGALIISSPQLVQLSRPFPYYSRTLSTIPMLRRSHSKVVGRMNTMLDLFYKRTMNIIPFPE